MEDERVVGFSVDLERQQISIEYNSGRAETALFCESQMLGDGSEGELGRGWLDMLRDSPQMLRGSSDPYIETANFVTEEG